MYYHPLIGLCAPECDGHLILRMLRAVAVATTLLCAVVPRECVSLRVVRTRSNGVGFQGHGRRRCGNVKVATYVAPVSIVAPHARLALRRRWREHGGSARYLHKKSGRAGVTNSGNDTRRRSRHVAKAKSIEDLLPSLSAAGDGDAPTSTSTGVGGEVRPSTIGDVAKVRATGRGSASGGDGVGGNDDPGVRSLVDLVELLHASENPLWDLIRFEVRDER